MEHDEIGYHDKFYGQDHLYDKEKYVDQDISLVKYKEHSDVGLSIFSYLNVNVSPDVYYEYQDW